MHLLTESVRDIRSDARIQEALEQEPDGETERNKDDITHCQIRGAGGLALQQFGPQQASGSPSEDFQDGF